MLYAHTTDSDDKGTWQPLAEHLENVASQAAVFAESFGAQDWAHLVGLVHDAGKASQAFQRRLEGAKAKVDHASAGAQLLAKDYAPLGKLLAYLVAGHHGGLPNGCEPSEPKGRRTLRERLADEVENYSPFLNIVEMPEKGFLATSMPDWLSVKYDSRERMTFAVTFLLRMLYSCLVDADSLDTEQVMSAERAVQRVYRGFSLPQMRDKLADKISSFAADTPVNEARADIHAACLEATDGKPGIYLLNVPTGGGKTLAGLDFALNHALKNGQGRVVYAIPYTSIIEQTAGEFKKLFGADSVLEHHSNYEFDKKDDEKRRHGIDEEDDERYERERLAMENWDVPLVVTTNVQLFESLYSDKPSHCRKNHNLANSVVVLDEAQSIPDALLEPCLAALEELAAHYGTTIVLCTATQPNLDGVWPFEASTNDIVPMQRRHAELFEARTAIEYVGKIEADDLVSRIASENQVLCIVSTRKAAAVLYDRLKELNVDEGLFHLSASMVPAHRSVIFQQIRERLAAGLPCRVVSTQLVEAGVDVDFPVVFRELAGIDSIKQAAGRCNREGKIEKGRVFVFDCSEFAIKDPEEEPKERDKRPSTTMDWLLNMRELGKATIEQIPRPFADEGVSHFFEHRFKCAKKDKFGVLDDFANWSNLKSTYFSFESCGKNFRFVEDEGVSVFVPWGDGGLALLEKVRAGEVDIRTARAMQRYTASVPRWLYEKLDEQSAIVQYSNMPYRILEPMNGRLRCYSDEKGIVVEGGGAGLDV